MAVGSDQTSALRPLTPEPNFYPATRLVLSKAKPGYCSIQNPPAISCLNQGKTQHQQCPCRPYRIHCPVVLDFTFDDYHPLQSHFPLPTNTLSSCHLNIHPCCAVSLKHASLRVSHGLPWAMFFSESSSDHSVQ